VPEYVAILEDNAERIAEMRACLSEALPACQSVFFDRSKDMIAWLAEHQDEVALISLDHDLPFVRDDEAQLDDFGNGREVADFLASRLPTCPVIVHSSNAPCASGMHFALNDAAWPCRRVYPGANVTWVRDAWGAQVKAYRNEGWFER
jgi:hypothetical protein